jgi:hypothetical protein
LKLVNPFLFTENVKPVMTKSVKNCRESEGKSLNSAFGRRQYIASKMYLVAVEPRLEHKKSEEHLLLAQSSES